MIPGIHAFFNTSVKNTPIQFLELHLKLQEYCISMQ